MAWYSGIASGFKGLMAKWIKKGGISAEKLSLLDGSGSAVNWSRNGYHHDMVRAIIDCIATQVAKSEVMHVVMDENGRIQKIVRNSPYSKLLNARPNDLMSGYDIKYKLAAQLEMYTTALCYIKWDGLRPEMMIPVDYSQYEILEMSGEGYAIRITDRMGERTAVPLEDVVIIRKFYAEGEASGDGNEPLREVLRMQAETDEGLQRAIRTSNRIRGLLKQKVSMLDAEDSSAAGDAFGKRFDKAAETGGVVSVDAKEDFVPLTMNSWAANASQVAQVKTRILDYFRVTENIIKSSYTEAEFQAFFESVIEPILINMGQAFTNACFTQREKDVGNRIIFTSDTMVNVSMGAKTQLVLATKELGIWTPNEIRSMFGFSPVEGGDERMVSLNYVKGSEQSEYQLGEQGTTQPNGGEGQ
jgi:HK97 family phage portal protein